MKNLIKILLGLVILTFMFIKVYVPLMSEEIIFNMAQKATISIDTRLSLSKEGDTKQ
jgi:hypothetical protein